MTGMLSARQAATICHVSERTIRNWISAGKLPAERTPEGFRVREEDLAGKLPTHAEARSESSGSGGTGSAVSVDLSELVHLVAKLQADVVSKAEAAAMWQARAEMLAAQLEQAQRALPAPQPPQPAQDAPRGDSVAPRYPEASVSATALRRPWWMFWRA